VRRFLKIGCSAVAIAIAVLGVAVVVFFSGRGKTPPIQGDHSIATLEKVRIGNADQWLLLRGHDRTKPVLLFLHGGPGMPAMFLAHAFQRELERNFVVVHWDRRGAGKSYASGADTSALNVRQMLDDTFSVTRLLRLRFHQDRIYLVAHSWGTYLGLLAIREHPEYYAAYIGTGQMAGSLAQVRTIQTDFILRCATQANDSATISRARRGGPIDEDMLFRCHGELWKSTSFLPILITGLRAPEYTFRDAFHVKPAANHVNRAMKYNVDPQPLRGEVKAVNIPVFFFLGRHDYNTPSLVAAQYLYRLNAPLKSQTWFERSAHFPFFEEPETFSREMVRANAIVREYWRTDNAHSLGIAPPNSASLHRTRTRNSLSPKV
jgi:pimeloyl-ACP methyl ester carboxylesterase